MSEIWQAASCEAQQVRPQRKATSTMRPKARRAQQRFVVRGALLASSLIVGVYLMSSSVCFAWQSTYGDSSDKFHLASATTAKSTSQIRSPQQQQQQQQQQQNLRRINSEIARSQQAQQQFGKRDSSLQAANLIEAAEAELATQAPSSSAPPELSSDTSADSSEDDDATSGETSGDYAGDEAAASTTEAPPPTPPPPPPQQAPVNVRRSPQSSRAPPLPQLTTMSSAAPQLMGVSTPKLVMQPLSVLPATLSTTTSSGNLLRSQPATMATPTLRTGARTQRPTQQPQATTTTTFDVGGERIFINRQQQEPQSTATTLSSGNNEQRSSGQLQATNFAGRMNGASFNGGYLPLDSIGGDRPTGGPNERRQDLLVPAASSSLQDLTASYAPLPSDRLPQHHRQQQQQQQQAQRQHYDSDGPSEGHFLQPATCYTALVLLLVAASSALITLLVTLATHLLLKHLGRHQLDLIESSRNYNKKHNNGFKRPDAGCGANQQSWSIPQSISTGATSLSNATTTCCRPRHEGAPRLDEQCGFDNPYFTGHNNNNNDSGSHWQQQLVGKHQMSGGLLTQVPYEQQEQHQQLDSAVGVGGLSFIANHISNLHSRQVTSSVGQLGNEAHQHHQVVDLTSDEQRARVLANPREGDLVAVDITGHDFIGLGFDVCGNPQEGVFVRSVLARGPARESGCVEPGDRIKCLNVSFENITLEDAFELLNCAAPYKLRILLEKRALPADHRLLQDRSAPVILSGPLSATRSYLRKLTGRFGVGAGSGADHQHQLHHHSPRDYSSSIEQRLLSSGYSQDGRASSSNTQALVSKSSLIQDLGQVNAGFGGAESDTDLSPQVDPTSGLQAQINPLLNRDNCSLEYRSTNATHKLHGPSFELPSFNQAAAKPPNIMLATGDNQALDLSRVVTSSESALRKDGHRSRSLAGADLTSRQHQVAADSLIKVGRQLNDAHLEQTQSQPAIAMQSSNEQSISNTNNNNNISSSSKSLAQRRVAADEQQRSTSGANVGEPTNDNSSNGQRRIDSPEDLPEANSTPTVVLLGASEPANWRVSMRRRKMQEEEANISTTLANPTTTLPTRDNGEGRARAE